MFIYKKSYQFIFWVLLLSFTIIYGQQVLKIKGELSSQFQSSFKARHIFQTADGTQSDTEQSKAKYDVEQDSSSDIDSKQKKSYQERLSDQVSDGVDTLKLAINSTVTGITAGMNDTVAANRIKQDGIDDDIATQKEKNSKNSKSEQIQKDKDTSKDYMQDTYDQDTSTSQLLQKAQRTNTGSKYNESDDGNTGTGQNKQSQTARMKAGGAKGDDQTSDQKQNIQQKSNSTIGKFNEGLQDLMNSSINQTAGDDNQNGSISDTIQLDKSSAGKGMGIVGDEDTFDMNITSLFDESSRDNSTNFSNNDQSDLAGGFNATATVLKNAGKNATSALTKAKNSTAAQLSNIKNNLFNGKQAGKSNHTGNTSSEELYIKSRAKRNESEQVQALDIDDYTSKVQNASHSDKLNNTQKAAIAERQKDEDSFDSTSEAVKKSHTNTTLFVSDNDPKSSYGKNFTVGNATSLSDDTWLGDQQLNGATNSSKDSTLLLGGKTRFNTSNLINSTDTSRLYNTTEKEENMLRNYDIDDSESMKSMAKNQNDTTEGQNMYKESQRKGGNNVHYYQDELNDLDETRASMNKSREDVQFDGGKQIVGQADDDDSQANSNATTQQQDIAKHKTDQELEKDFITNVLNRTQNSTFQDKQGAAVKTNNSKAVFIGDSNSKGAVVDIGEYTKKAYKYQWIPSLQSMIIIGLIALLSYVLYRSRKGSGSSSVGISQYKDLHNRHKKQDIEGQPILGHKGQGNGTSQKGPNGEEWKDF